MTGLEILGVALLLSLGLPLLVAPVAYSAWLERLMPVDKRRDSKAFYARRSNRVVARAVGAVAVTLGVLVFLALR